ncbi:hypothetical protein BGZ98_003444 [Dissophora globulifera]|nr:hypothetical protein BGZ98_003444 [Dissophora globulifera]
MDWPQHRRLQFSLRRRLRRVRTNFRLHARRNIFLLLISTLVLLQLISRTSQRYSSVDLRWRKLQQFSQPGTLGAPSEVELNSANSILIRLCGSDGILCSTWTHNRTWDRDELKLDESWLTPGSIRVPIGVQATLTMDDGRRQILRYGQHQCDRTTLRCEEIKSLVVEASILSAIDAISQACSGDNWSKEPAIIHTVKPKMTFTERDVTMVAQFSISRLDRFEHARAVWAGPISVVIFLATNSDIAELKAYFERPGKLELYNSITLTIVKPNYSLGTHTRYPINHLRNIGIQTASTDYIYVIDADFVPTSKLYSFAKTSLVPLLEKSTEPVAYVVPCLAIKVDFKGKYPDTIKELQPLMKSGMAYITDPRAGHGPTFTPLFMNTVLFGNSPAYEVCYESQWEPYYIVKRAPPHPYYDERFKNQGGDKQSHALLLNAIGFKFLVLRDHFMYHMDHPKLKWTGDGLDQVTQRDFTYFSDYAPELEMIFGSNYRWPRGCSRPLVQSFKHDLLGIGTM